jgi:lysophospholipase L1-like esterase
MTTFCRSQPDPNEDHTPRRAPGIARGLATLALLIVGFSIIPNDDPALATAEAKAEPAAFPFRDGDRVAWVGSSSTNIYTWNRTVEFLLRTRHPELKLSFRKQSSGGGTFATGAQKLDMWLDDFKPTLVVFNYGGNDANADKAGLPKFKENIEKCVEKVEEHKARFVFTTHQAADVRKSKEAPAEKRKLYAEAMLAFAKEKNWPIVDVFHPLDELQRQGQKENDSFTILKDSIHLTDSAYVAWGYYFYEGLKPPSAVSAAELTAGGEVKKTTRCKITDVKATDKGLTFVRSDEVLPILPPLPPPPRKWAPLEKLSDYRLTVTGLPEGTYEVLAEGKSIGTTEAADLARGVNLNSLLLESMSPAPWEALAKQIWAGKDLDQIGKTAWKFEVHRILRDGKAK